MALFRSRITFEANSGVSADRVNLTMGWVTEATPEVLAADLAARFEAQAINSGAFTQINTRYATGYLPIFYEIFPPTGGAALAVEPTPGVWTASGTGAGPHETALVVTYLTQTARGPAPKGRNYYGPWASGQVQTPRPVTAHMQVLAEFALLFSQAMLGDGHTQAVLNAEGTLAFPIIGFRVDDAWDTQRRRGLEPTTSEERLIP